MQRAEFINYISNELTGQENRWIKDLLLKKQDQIPEEVNDPFSFIHQMIWRFEPGTNRDYSRPCRYTIGDRPEDEALFSGKDSHDSQ